MRYEKHNSVLPNDQFQMNIGQIATILVVLYPSEMSTQCANDVTPGTASVYGIEPEILDSEFGSLTSPGYPEGIPERVRYEDMTDGETH